MFLGNNENIAPWGTFASLAGVAGQISYLPCMLARTLVLFLVLGWDVVELS